jgi:hypothetical protein
MRPRCGRAAAYGTNFELIPPERASRCKYLQARLPVDLKSDGSTNGLSCAPGSLLARIFTAYNMARRGSSSSHWIILRTLSVLRCIQSCQVRPCGAWIGNKPSALDATLAHDWSLLRSTATTDHGPPVCDSTNRCPSLSTTQFRLATCGTASARCSNVRARPHEKQNTVSN